MANIFSKLKGIFYDEVEVEGAEDELAKVSKIVKKEEKPKIEEIKVQPKEEVIEEVKPKIEVEEKPVPKTENTFSERELFRSERTFNFTEFDDEEEELPARRNVLAQETRNTRVERPVIEEKPAPKVFKPSPIISPIYGILDKDYKKEEIKTKSVGSAPVTSNVTQYDSIRRKAYGTLEDDLEDTLNSLNKITTDTIVEEVNKIDKEVEELEEKANKIEDLINRIEDATNAFDENMSVGEIEDRVKIANFEDEEEDVSDKTMTDSTLEHDLFNLIDSIYDDKED